MRILLTTLIGALALLQASCFNDSRPIRIGSNVWPGYEPLYLARAKGLLNTNLVRLIELPSSSDVVDALLLGQLEGAALTLDEALRVHSREIDLVVIFVCDISNGADVILGRPHITDIAALENQRVAVNFGSVGIMLLDAALSSTDLTMDDIQTVNLAPDQQVNAWSAGTIDAAVSHEPFVSTLLQAGAQRLFDSSQIPDRIVDVMVIRRDVLPQHKHQLKSLAHAFFQARNMMIEQPEEAMEIINERLRLKPGDLDNAYKQLLLPDIEENQRFLNPTNGQLLSISNTLVRIMQSNGSLSHSPDLDNFFTDQFLPEP